MTRVLIRGLVMFAGLALLAIGLNSYGFFDRQMGTLKPENTDGVVPSGPVTKSTPDNYFVVKRDRDGYFYVDAWVNGDQVHFLVDTGSSYVTLTRERAADLGYDLWDEEFDRTVTLANGDTAKAAVINIDEIEVGDGIIARNVPALVVKEGDINLLGMSYLRKIGGFSVADNEMMFEAP